MDLRDALVLVADDADRSGLPGAANARARGDRIRHRRYGLGVAAAVASAAVLVVAVVSTAGGLRAAPRPAHPTPRPTHAALTVFHGGCGHGVSCPQGHGPIRLVMPAGVTGEQLSVDFTVPAGWAFWEGTDNGAILRTRSGDEGVSMLWPVRAPRSAPSAEALAAALARVRGSLSSTPQQVSFAGRTAWRVSLAHVTPEGPAPCLDPLYGLLVGEGGGRCRRLMALVGEDVPPASRLQPVGIDAASVVQITLVDGLGIRDAEGPDLLAVFRWAPDLATPSTSTRVLEELRLGRYAEPSCGALDFTFDSPCTPTTGGYVVHGAPVPTDTGIREWLSSVRLQLPAGWTVVSDDGRGDALLADQLGDRGAQVMWEPGLPTSPHRAVIDSHAAVLRTLAQRGVVAMSRPTRVRLGGAPAWTVALRADVGAVPYRQDACGQSSYYSIMLFCASTDDARHSAMPLEPNMRGQLWVVQAAPDRLVVLFVWGKRLRHIDPDPLPGTMAATRAMLSSLVIDAR